MGPWMNAEQAAEYLGFSSTKAIYQSVRRGQIPAHRLGNRLRFSAKELDELLLKNRTMTVDECRSQMLCCD